MILAIFLPPLEITKILFFLIFSGLFVLFLSLAWCLSQLFFVVFVPMRALRIHSLHQFAFFSVLLPFLPFAFCVAAGVFCCDIPRVIIRLATSLLPLPSPLMSPLHGVSLPSASMVESPSVAADGAHRFCAAVDSFCSVAASSASLLCGVSLDSLTFSASFAAAACLLRGIVSNSAYLLQLGVCLLCASTTSLETTLRLSSIWGVALADAWESEMCNH